MYVRIHVCLCVCVCVCVYTLKSNTKVVGSLGVVMRAHRSEHKLPSAAAGI